MENKNGEKAAFRGSPVTSTARRECWRRAGNAFAAHLYFWQMWGDRSKTVIWYQNINVNDCEPGQH